MSVYSEWTVGETEWAKRKVTVANIVKQPVILEVPAAVRTGYKRCEHRPMEGIYVVYGDSDVVWQTQYSNYFQTSKRIP